MNEHVLNYNLWQRLAAKLGRDYVLRRVGGEGAYQLCAVAWFGVQPYARDIKMRRLYHTIYVHDIPLTPRLREWHAAQELKERLTMSGAQQGRAQALSSKITTGQSAPPPSHYDQDEAMNRLMQAAIAKKKAQP